MKITFDRRRSLQELENDDWGEPDYHTYLVQTCHRLRRVPVADLSNEDLRILIGQKIGLLFPVPLALEKLANDPLAEGHFYPGDLLKAILDIPVAFWSVHTDMCEVLRKILVKTEELLLMLEKTEARPLREALVKILASLRE